MPCLRVRKPGRACPARVSSSLCFRSCGPGPGQAPSQAMLLAEVKQALRANIGWQRILSYLKFLEGSLLLRLVRPLELRLKKVRGPAKVCVVEALTP